MRFGVRLFVVLLFFWLYCVTTVTPFITQSNSGYAIKPKKTSKRQSTTKMQWNTLQVSLFYSFHLRKSKVERYLVFADLCTFLLQSLLYFQRSPVTRLRRVTYGM